MRLILSGMRALVNVIVKALRDQENDQTIKAADIAWALGYDLPDGYAKKGDKVVHITLGKEYGNQPVVVAYKSRQEKLTK